MTERKWWSCQVDRETAEKYKAYFRENDIYFEPSEADYMVHLSCEMNEEEYELAEQFLKLLREASLNA